MKKKTSIYRGKRKRKWIKKSIRHRGGLSRQLGIKEKDNIPVSLLKKIKRAKPGTTLTNPTKTGKKRIRVTKKMKRRANLALTLKRMKKKKRR